jgi:hypothetical protein
MTSTISTAPTSVSNRRRHPRFVLSPMYTPITVRLLDDERFLCEGHTYNLSEGGVQFELDKPIAPGTPVAIQVTMPCAPGEWDGTGPGRSVFAFANIVWLDDAEPGPVRMAAVITRFVRPCDRERLLRQFASGRFALAA